MNSLIASFLNLAGPDLLVIGVIIAVLAAPAVMAIPIVFYLDRRRKKPPPLPSAVEK